MKCVYIAYTADESGEIYYSSFESKSAATVYLWNWYMKNHFDPELVEDDWASLKLDGFIAGLCSIGYDKIIEESDMTFKLKMMVDLNGYEGD